MPWVKEQMTWMEYIPVQVQPGNSEVWVPPKSPGPLWKGADPSRVMAPRQSFLSFLFMTSAVLTFVGLMGLS